MEEFTIGSIVEVTLQYRGGGGYGRDGNEGVYTVVGRNSLSGDYYLAKGHHTSIDAAIEEARQRNWNAGHGRIGRDLTTHTSGCRIKPLVGPARSDQRQSWEAM